MRRLTETLLADAPRLVLPVLTFPGAALAGVTIRQMVTCPEAQVAAVQALHDRYQTPVVLSAMDLSVESEAFGCDVQFGDAEVPTVTGRRVVDRSGAEALMVPSPGDGRTPIYLETVRRLTRLPRRPWVLGGMVGPFSLASRLFGVSEMLGLTLDDPDLAHLLLAKATRFLGAYAVAFREAGADGVVMAEPTAGLLSPRSLGAFSSAYVRQVVTLAETPGFTVILHNCGARLVHLPEVLNSGARVFHFGSPMDLPTALRQVPATTVICGNLDPSRVFVQSTPAEVTAATRALRETTAGHPNHVMSSGCDIPPGTPLANLDAFFAAAGAA